MASNVEAYVGLGGVGLVGALLANAARLAAPMVADGVGEQQLAHALPLLFTLAGAFGAIVGTCVLVVKAGWSMYLSLKKAMADAAEAAVAGHKAAIREELATLREEFAAVRGELTVIRRMLQLERGHTPPPVELR